MSAFETFEEEEKKESEESKSGFGKSVAESNVAPEDDHRAEWDF